VRVVSCGGAELAEATKYKRGYKHNLQADKVIKILPVDRTVSE